MKQYFTYYSLVLTEKILKSVINQDKKKAKFLQLPRQNFQLNPPQFQTVCCLEWCDRMWIQPIPGCFWSLLTVKLAQWTYQYAECHESVAVLVSEQYDVRKISQCFYIYYRNIMCQA